MIPIGDEENQVKLVIEAIRDIAYEEGIEQKNKESVIRLYNNGVSDELIMNSLDITKEKLDEYLKEK